MSARRWPLALALVCALAGVARAAPETAPPAAGVSDKTERVIGLARVWAHARYYHPYLAYRSIDWDAALVAAIPRVEAATDDAAYRAAIDGMLKVLGDPASRVLPAAAPAAAAAAPAAPAGDFLTWPAKDVMHVDLARLLVVPDDFNAIMIGSQRVINDAPRARAIIIDLGGRQREETAWAVPWAVEQMQSVLPGSTAWPTERIVEHRGFRTQEGSSSGNYRSLFISIGGAPARKGPAKGPGHVVFVIRDDVPVPPLAIALQAEGRATLIATRKLDDSSVVTTSEVAAAGGVRARLRVGELEWGAVTADTVVAAGKDPAAAALAAARASLGRRATPRRRAAAPTLPPYVVRNDDDHAATPYPSRELRMLGAIRLWAVLDQFFPYRYLITDWDAALRDALPAVAAAPDAAGYKRALQVMAARAHDGHVGVFSTSERAERMARGIPPFLVRMVEGKLAVVQILDAAAAAKLGIGPGDIIETIDGTPTADALAALRPITSASNDEALVQRLAGAVLVGDDGSTVTLGVRGAKGPRRDVAVTRSRAHLVLQWNPPPAPAWKLLPGDVGYVDLVRLEVPEVPAMFAALATTEAIVFDMRGYPNGTAWSIAPRINTRRARYGASFLQPLRGGAGGDLDDFRIRFLQQIPALEPGASIYPGKIVVLIDDRAISQSEHSCLFYQETAGAIFVGSPTAGANGDVTMARLPGGLRLAFTGQEVRHVDGKQLQQVGIQPHVLVRPTLAGLRAGKDEVLERALVRIKTGT